MRHMIIRGIVAVAWSAAGIVELTQGKTDIAIISLALGVAYGSSCYKMIKRNK